MDGMGDGDAEEGFRDGVLVMALLALMGDLDRVVDGAFVADAGVADDIETAAASACAPHTASNTTITLYILLLMSIVRR